MTRSGGRAVLRRGPGARLFAGYWFQGFLTIAVLFSLALGSFVTVLVGPSTNLLGFLGVLAFLVIWGFGVTAYAHADDDGLRWRYFARHAHPWSEIQQIRLGSTFVPGLSVGASAPAVFVTSNGREKPIRPSYGCSAAHRTEFGAALATLAAAHGVPTSVSNAGWEGLDGATPQVDHAPFAPPGVRRSAQNTRIRVAVFGLALFVAGVLSIVGAFTGWDNAGTNPVTLGVVGAVLVLIGAAVAALMLVSGP